MRRVRLPDGRVIDDYHQLKAPDFTMVLAMTAGGTVVTEKMYKHGIGGEAIVLPAGGLQPGASPDDRMVQEDATCRGLSFTLTKDRTFFFLAEFPVDFAMWAGIVQVIRERHPNARTVLVMAGEPFSRHYDFAPIAAGFDTVLDVRPASYAGGVGPRRILQTLLGGFRAARKTAADVGRVGIGPGDIAFAAHGVTLTAAIFLKRVARTPGATSVLLRPRNAAAQLHDFVYDRERSLLFSLYNRFFATYSFDLFWLRSDGDTPVRGREYVFTADPADFVFDVVVPLPAPQELATRQVLRPVPVRDVVPDSGDGAVVFFGQPYQWQRAIPVEPFRKRLSYLLGCIRKRHPGARLIYKTHPAEKPEDLASMDLTGFEIEDSISAELLTWQDTAIFHTYSVWSTSSSTALGMGVRSHLLFELFDDAVFPAPVRQLARTQTGAAAAPQLLITSEDDWLAGRCDYPVEGVAAKVRASTESMLDEVSRGPSESGSGRVDPAASVGQAIGGGVGGESRISRMIFGWWAVRLASLFSRERQ